MQLKRGGNHAVLGWGGIPKHYLKEAPIKKTGVVSLFAVLKDAWCFHVVEGVRTKKRVRGKKEGMLQILPLTGLCSVVENNCPSTMLSHCIWQAVISL